MCIPGKIRPLGALGADRLTVPSKASRSKISILVRPCTKVPRTHFSSWVSSLSKSAWPREKGMTPGYSSDWEGDE